MKVVILAGGTGTRLSEETSDRPKPMVEIGGRPILWHIMKGYASRGLTEFVVALGYRGEVIKDFFLDFHHRARDLTVRLDSGEVTASGERPEPWVVHLLDTGLASQTGGRLRRAAAFVGGETFMMTYGDGVCDVDARKLIEFHRRHGKLVTVTAVRPPARFGCMALDGDLVTRFEEKPQIGAGWINGGFFVLEPRVTDFLDGDDAVWERAPLERLAAAGEVMAYRHEGFWQCMDTRRDVALLNQLWQGGSPPWKVWP